MVITYVYLCVFMHTKNHKIVCIMVFMRIVAFLKLF